MKILYVLGATLPLLSGCGSECGYGTQMVGRNIAITGPSGNVSGIGTINTGSIQDQSVYALTSQRVTDLVQQMQICCTNKLRAQKGHDQANVAWWTNEEHKCFEQMLDLQNRLPPSNAPATVAPSVGTAPKLAGPAATAQFLPKLHRNQHALRKSNLPQRVLRIWHNQKPPPPKWKNG